MSNNQQTSQRIQKLLDNLTEDFSIDKLSKSPARFNQGKLDWINKEYFKLMKLPEFALRYSQWKLQYSHQKTLKEKTENGELEADYQPKFRTGDYLMPVDFKTQKVFINKDLCHTAQDGKCYLIGGGRNANETGMQGLLREASEELIKDENQNFKIDEKSVKKVAEFKIWAGKKFEKDGETYDGKNFHIYCLPVDQKDLKPFILEESGNNWDFDWCDLGQVIETNHFVTYPIWQNFCIQNNLSILPPTNDILTNYLSLLLDKNRASKFSEVGIDSTCVTDWQKPSDEDLKWKKLTLEESKKNLKEIWTAVKTIFYDKHTKLQEKFLLFILKDLLLNDKESNINSKHTNLNLIFLDVADLWESEIKMWLKDGDKKAGDYLWPLRVALSGKKTSPSPFELLAILPKSEADRRIKESLI